jgi:hypothetical protein
MKAEDRYTSNSERSGLVIVFPTGVKSLFNPGVHKIVREVERRLDGKFVTYALSGGATPDVGAAVNAARFAGCSSAIVVHTDDWLDSDDWVEPGADTLWSEWHDTFEARDTVERVVAAYARARATTEMAA